MQGLESHSAHPTRYVPVLRTEHSCFSKFVTCHQPLELGRSELNDGNTGPCKKLITRGISQNKSKIFDGTF